MNKETQTTWFASRKKLPTKAGFYLATVKTSSKELATVGARFVKASRPAWNTVKVAGEHYFWEIQGSYIDVPPTSIIAWAFPPQPYQESGNVTSS